MTSVSLILIAGVASFFAFAPFGQFYLAWVAAVPVLWLVATSRSWWTAAVMGYGYGVVYFGGNLWYLWYIGLFPLLGAMFYLAFYPALFALLWRPMAKRGGLTAVVGGAVTWVAIDWIRAHVLTGLPYVFLGHAQHPVPALTQIADATGVHGVTFLVLLLNGLVWQAIVHRGRMKPVLPTAGVVGAVAAAVLVYGWFRLAERDFQEGPRVMLLQPHFELLNTEAVDDVALINWLAGETVAAMRRQESPIDLVVWPESSVPPLNPETRGLSFAGKYGGLIRETHELLRQLSDSGPSLMIGGSYRSDWRPDGDRLKSFDKRNSVYFYEDGEQSTLRYDKQHLFPFGEYIPFGEQPVPIRWMHGFFQLFNPWGEDHSLTEGTEDTVFEVAGVRIIAPICFEDIVARRVRDLAYDGATKRADLLVNVTNDGWFRGNQMAQHLQAAAFRSIENRIPTARSVNNGVSAIIDPDGRVRSFVPAATEGSVVGPVLLDSRSTLYGRFGDLFAYLCLVATAGFTIIGTISRRTAP